MKFFPAKLLKRFSKKRGSRCAVVIVAAGASVRMAGVDKLYADLCGKPVLARTLLAFEASDLISEIVLVVSASQRGTAARICSENSITKLSCILTGGATRAESSFVGVSAVSKRTDLIAIHDGARPLVSQEVIKAAVESAAVSGSGVPARPVTATLKRVESAVVRASVDRANVWEIQTPQVFQADLIRSALKSASDNKADITDDCSAAELAGIPVNITPGSPENIKITTPEDLAFAEVILKGEGLTL